jgi:hypothetical protein
MRAVRDLVIANANRRAADSVVASSLRRQLVESLLLDRREILGADSRPPLDDSQASSLTASL